MLTQRHIPPLHLQLPAVTLRDRNLRHSSQRPNSVCTARTEFACLLFPSSFRTAWMCLLPSPPPALCLASLQRWASGECCPPSPLLPVLCDTFLLLTRCAQQLCYSGGLWNRTCSGLGQDPGAFNLCAQAGRIPASVRNASRTAQKGKRPC